MAKASVTPPLVVAAAAVHDEVRGYAELAAEAKRLSLDGEKSLAKASRLLQEAAGRHDDVQKKVQSLVGEIEQVRRSQEESLTALMDLAQRLETRTARFRELSKRFGALGELAQGVNRLAGELSARKAGGAAEQELLSGLRAIEEQVEQVVGAAGELSRDAQKDEWPEMARQADAVRQQVHAAKNKLLLAHQAVARRSPS
jgi:hypothetical protein